MAAGPTRTTKMPGKIKSTSGKISCTAVLAAFPRPIGAAGCASSRSASAAPGHARSEAVGLNEDRRQGPQIGHAGPRAQFVEHFNSRAAHLQLEVGDHKLLGQNAIGLAHLFGHLAHRLVEAQAGLDADHHQVQGVGQGQEDGLFPAAAHETDNEVGQVEQQSTQRDGVFQRV